MSKGYSSAKGNLPGLGEGKDQHDAPSPASTINETFGKGDFEISPPRFGEGAGGGEINRTPPPYPPPQTRGRRIFGGAGRGTLAAFAAYGAAREQSRGKDTPSGHWEMTGVPVTFDWGYFSNEQPCFPAALTSALVEQADLPGLLGNRHASGTQIIEDLGAEHVASGKPIVYTSADSVFQIAAHEDSFGLERLYGVCAVARKLVDDYDIGRVIARPFIGASGNFERTGNRRDYTTPPPEPTLLDRLCADGGEVISVGKVSDIFAHQGISRTVKAHGNAALWDATLTALADAPERSLIFTNFVDFDTLYGHRRNVAGYAAALEAFDARLPFLESALQTDDLAIITADHGCDPTWSGTDHTRENVPVLAFGSGVAPGPLGLRESFADIGQTVAAHIGLAALPHGTSFHTQEHK
ncbi:MAG: phosphopentomutase [Proteobacteria bacterium]|nr:phosphopentomutase [Pseudomonadota bacterium]